MALLSLVEPLHMCFSLQCRVLKCRWQSSHWEKMLHISLIALGVIHFLFFHLSFALLSRNTSIPRTFLSYIPLRTHIVKMNFASTKIIFCITNGHKFKDGSSNFINPRTPFLKTLSTVQNSLSSMHVVPILHFHSCLHGWKIIYITICVLKIHQFVNVQNV